MADTEESGLGGLTRLAFFGIGIGVPLYASYKEYAANHLGSITSNIRQQAPVSTIYPEIQNARNAFRTAISNSDKFTELQSHINEIRLSASSSTLNNKKDALKKVLGNRFGFSNELLDQLMSTNDSQTFFSNITGLAGGNKFDLKYIYSAITQIANSRHGFKIQTPQPSTIIPSNPRLIDRSTLKELDDELNRIKNMSSVPSGLKDYWDQGNRVLKENVSNFLRQGTNRSVFVDNGNLIFQVGGMGIGRRGQEPYKFSVPIVDPSNQYTRGRAKYTASYFFNADIYPRLSAATDKRGVLKTFKYLRLDQMMISAINSGLPQNPETRDLARVSGTLKEILGLATFTPETVGDGSARALQSLRPDKLHTRLQAQKAIPYISNLGSFYFDQEVLKKIADNGDASFGFTKVIEGSQLLEQYGLGISSGTTPSNRVLGAGVIKPVDAAKAAQLGLHPSIPTTSSGFVDFSSITSPGGPSVDPRVDQIFRPFEVFIDPFNDNVSARDYYPNVVTDDYKAATPNKDLNIFQLRGLSGSDAALDFAFEKYPLLRPADESVVMTPNFSDFQMQFTYPRTIDKDSPVNSLISDLLDPNSDINKIYRTGANGQVQMTLGEAAQSGSVELFTRKYRKALDPKWAQRIVEKIQAEANVTITNLGTHIEKASFEATGSPLIISQEIIEDVANSGEKNLLDPNDLTPFLKRHMRRQLGAFKRTTMLRGRELLGFTPSGNPVNINEFSKAGTMIKSIKRTDSGNIELSLSQIYDSLGSKFHGDLKAQVSGVLPDAPLADNALFRLHYANQILSDSSLATELMDHGFKTADGKLDAKNAISFMFGLHYRNFQGKNPISSKVTVEALDRAKITGRARKLAVKHFKNLYQDIFDNSLRWLNSKGNDVALITGEMAPFKAGLGKHRGAFLSTLLREIGDGTPKTFEEIITTAADKDVINQRQKTEILDLQRDIDTYHQTNFVDQAAREAAETGLIDREKKLFQQLQFSKDWSLQLSSGGPDSLRGAGNIGPISARGVNILDRLGLGDAANDIRSRLIQKGSMAEDDSGLEWIYRQTQAVHGDISPGANEVVIDDIRSKVGGNQDFLTNLFSNNPLARKQAYESLGTDPSKRLLIKMDVDGFYGDDTSMKLRYLVMNPSSSPGIMQTPEGPMPILNDIQRHQKKILERILSNQTTSINTEATNYLDELARQSGLMIKKLGGGKVIGSSYLTLGGFDRGAFEHLTLSDEGKRFLYNLGFQQNDLYEAGKIKKNALDAILDNIFISSSTFNKEIDQLGLSETESANFKNELANYQMPTIVGREPATSAVRFGPGRLMTIEQLEGMFKDGYELGENFLNKKAAYSLAGGWHIRNFGGDFDGDNISQILIRDSGVRKRLIKQVDLMNTYRRAINQTSNGQDIGIGNIDQIMSLARADQAVAAASNGLDRGTIESAESIVRMSAVMNQYYPLIKAKVPGVASLSAEQQSPELIAKRIEALYTAAWMEKGTIGLAASSNAMAINAAWNNPGMGPSTRTNIEMMILLLEENMLKAKANRKGAEQINSANQLISLFGGSSQGRSFEESKATMLQVLQNLYDASNNTRQAFQNNPETKRQFEESAVDLLKSVREFQNNPNRELIRSSKGIQNFEGLTGYFRSLIESDNIEAESLRRATEPEGALTTRARSVISQANNQSDVFLSLLKKRKKDIMIAGGIAVVASALVGPGSISGDSAPQTSDAKKNHSMPSEAGQSTSYPSAVRASGQERTMIHRQSQGNITGDSFAAVESAMAKLKRNNLSPILRVNPYQRSAYPEYIYDELGQQS